TEHFESVLLWRFRNESSHLTAVANKDDLFLLALDFLQHFAKSPSHFTDGERFHTSQPNRCLPIWQSVSWNRMGQSTRHNDIHFHSRVNWRARWRTGSVMV